MKITVNDRSSYAITRREYTDEGFLRVPGRVARTGIQEYLASELQVNDRKANDIIRIHRPEEEVFNQDSLDSYAGADVTIEHPPKMVDAESYKQYSVGTARSTGTRDGDFVTVDLIIKDKKAIEAVESGKVQLSAGYTAEYDMTPGVTTDGVQYDGIQRSIKINHVAIVDRARAGSMARLFDHKGVKAMTKITLDSGRTVEIEDKSAGALIVDSIERLTNESETRQAVIDSQAEQIEELKQKTSDEAINSRVKALVESMDAAKRVAGSDFTCDSVEEVEIKRAALAKVKPNVDWSDKHPAYVLGAFDEQPDMKKEDEEDEEEMKDAGGRGKVRPKSDSKDSYSQLAQDAAFDAEKQQKKVSAYDSHKESLSNAWKQEK